jgi:small-conductance mechanosensitive channel
LERPQSGALGESVQRLERELTESIPKLMKEFAEKAGVFLTDKNIDVWIRNIKASASLGEKRQVNVEKVRRLATLWKRRAGLGSGSRHSSTEYEFRNVVKDFVVKTNIVQGMLTDLRMNMPSVDCPVVLLPSNSMDSGSEAKQADDMFAKKLGFYIFFQLKEDGNRLDLVSEDLRHFFTDETERAHAWDTLDWSCTNSVGLYECVKFVSDFFKLRREVTRMKLDSADLMTKIDRSIASVSVLIMLLVILDTTNLIAFSRLWQGFSAVVIVFSFVFGNSIRQAWENLIYILSVRAFDVGDTIIVNDKRHEVQRIMLGFVECTTVSNAVVNVPMQKFLDNEVVNVSRTVEEWGGVSMLVDIGTTADQLGIIASEVARTIYEEKLLFSGLYRVCLEPWSSTSQKWLMVVQYKLRGNGVDLVERGQAVTHMCIAVARGIAAAGMGDSNGNRGSGTAMVNATHGFNIVKADDSDDCFAINEDD